jgi:signal transduction histidine kinase
MRHQRTRRLSKDVGNADATVHPFLKPFHPFMIALPSRNIRVLLIERDAGLHRRVAGFLAESAAERYELAPFCGEPVGAADPDVTLLGPDPGLPGFAELPAETLAQAFRTPLILLQPEHAPPGQGLAAGAADCLSLAHLDGPGLRCSIRYALRQSGRGDAGDLRRQLEERILVLRDYEQRRIGADLHDHLGQHLTGIACLVTALRAQLEREGSALAARANEIAGCVNGAIEITRLLARGLCPAHVEPWGLRAALADLAAQVQRLQGVACVFEPAGPAAGEDPETAIQAYRIAQEAISNAIRHGRASRIVLRLDTTDGQIRLAIEDDGDGFPRVAPDAPGGLGLLLMEHRAATRGGQFRIRSQARGVHVECLFPRSQAPHAVEA